MLEASYVCKHWHRLASHSGVWRAIFYTQPGWELRTELLAPASTDAPIFTRHLPTYPLQNTHWKTFYMARWELERRWYSTRSRPVGPDGQTPFRPRISRFRGHRDSVYCCCVDRELHPGQASYLITGSRDNTIKVWNSGTGACMSTMEGHSGSVLCLKHEPGFLVSGSSDTTARIWYPSRRGSGSLYEPGPVLRGHKAGVLSVAFDDKYIVTASRDTTLRVWVRATGELLHVYDAHAASVNACSLQNGIVASGAGDGSLRLWSAATGQTCQTISGPRCGIASLVLTPQWLLTGSSDSAIRFWDTKTGACLATFRAHEKLVRTIAYEATRKLLVSGGWDRKTRLWDVEPLLNSLEEETPANPRMTLELGVQQARVFDVCLDTTRVISACEDNTLWITDYGGQGLATHLFA